jgi:hypothetical protein
MDKLKFKSYPNPLIRFNTVRSMLIYACIASLVSCAPSLAPQYNQAIVDNMSLASKETLQLLAAVSGGSNASDFGSRESQYNSVIGTLDAIKIQIQARPLPQKKTLDKILKKVNEQLKARGKSEINAITPSLKAIEQIIANVTKMKEVDKAQGITPDEATLFKGNVNLFFDQAITYEAFLNN